MTSPHYHQRIASIPKHIQDCRILNEILHYYRCVQFKIIIMQTFQIPDGSLNIIPTTCSFHEYKQHVEVINCNLYGGYKFKDLTLSYWLYIFSFIDLRNGWEFNTISKSCKYFHVLLVHPFLLYQYLTHDLAIRDIEINPILMFQQFKYMTLKRRFEKNYK